MVALREKIKGSQKFLPFTLERLSGNQSVPVHPVDVEMFPFINDLPVELQKK